MGNPRCPARRRFLAAALATGALAALPRATSAARPPLLTRALPGRSERLPLLGMGSWLTFDIGTNARALPGRVAVLEEFFAAGGRLIDSSPMYMTSEATIGRCLALLGAAPVWSATKVWTMGADRGVTQMQRSREFWGVPRFDLMQVHNLLDWRAHLDTLRGWRDEGRIRYIGVTTSHGRRHSELAQIIREEDDVEFVQFTYNLRDREAEQRLLPLAADHGKAVIVNRPFRRRALIAATRRHALPEFAAQIGCATWPQYLLKFVISHPAVTCAIPATSRADHMIENMAAGRGVLPDGPMRARMAAHFDAL